MVERKFTIQNCSGHKQPLSIKIDDYKDVNTTRIFAMTRDQFKELLSCHATSAFQKKVPRSTSNLPECTVIARGKYTAGGNILSSGKMSEANPLALVIENPAGRASSLLKIDIDGGPVKTVTPTKICSSGDLAWLRQSI